MIDLTLIPDGGIGWLDASGPESHIVLSSRVRLARNIVGREFPPRTSSGNREEVLLMLGEAGRGTRTLAQAAMYRLDHLDPLDRQVLHERNLVSKELAGLERGQQVKPAAAVLTTGQLGMMINEEDHCRLQALQSGLAISEAFRNLERLDADLGQRVNFAFHPQFGYLTSCPTNAGTGLRASVLVHLPGLVLTKEISRVLQGLTQVGLTYRGLYGEGSEVVGNLFQLSNQTTLGKSENELLDQLIGVVRQVIGYEEQARRQLETDAPVVVADKVWRAYGILRHARSLSFEEGMNLLSGVRLGVGLGLITGVGTYTLNKLLIFTQPGHLAASETRDLKDPELNQIRASFVREMLDADASR